MNYSKKEIYEKLNQIFVKYKKRYKNPPSSKQLSCMWSATNPPDIIEDTPPFRDVENAFNISIGDDEDLWEDPRPPPQPLEMVCEPDADYVPWRDDVPEIEVG